MTALFFTTTGAFSPVEQELPVDETEAGGYLETGIIDSVLWHALLPLYRRPLQVPAGEAVQLIDLFPELSDVLPSDFRLLDRYRPWDSSSIARFFMDFPVMRNLRPVLQFDYHPSRYSGNVSFYMSSAGSTGQAVHSSRFAVSPLKSLRMQGTVDFTADFARWERRSFLVKPCGWVSVQAGNFSFRDDPGLLYGRFQDDTISFEDQAGNWLYGAARTWNGLCIDVSGKKIPLFSMFNPALTCFVHARPSESIAGGSLAFVDRKNITVTGGVTALTTGGRQVNFHGRVRASNPWLKSELDYGLVPGEKVQIPLMWKTAIRCGSRHAQISLIHLSNGFFFKQSAFLHRFQTEFALDENDTLTSALTLARLAVTDTAANGFSIKPGGELWFENGSIHHGTFRMHSSFRQKVIATALVLTADFPGQVGAGAAGRMEGTFRWSPLSVLALTAYQRCSCSESGYLRYRGRLSPAVIIFSRIHLEPSVSMISESGHGSQWLTGIRQKLVLFDRNCTEFFLEQNLGGKTRRESVRFEGRASFYF